jgi:AraC family transcriptional regulator
VSTNTWQQEHDNFNYRLAKSGVTPSLSLSSPNGVVQVAHANFDAFEYAQESSSRLMLNLCTSGVSKMGRFSDEANLEGTIRSGSVLVALPNSKSEIHCSGASMLGIAIDLSVLEKTTGEKFTVEGLLPAAQDFHQDPLLTSVMTALWRDAETNGLTSAFFEHGLLVILKQLENYRTKVHAPRVAKPISENRLKQSIEYINSEISSDIRVSSIAQEVNLDVRTFTRTFRAATGYAPFEYITLRRMEIAKELLLKGYNVTETSMAVGYLNPSKFSAAFRRLNGKAPKEWSMLHR